MEIAYFLIGIFLWLTLQLILGGVNNNAGEAIFSFFLFSLLWPVIILGLLVYEVHTAIADYLEERNKRQ